MSLTTAIAMLLSQSLAANPLMDQIFRGQGHFDTSSVSALGFDDAVLQIVHLLTRESIERPGTTRDHLTASLGIECPLNLAGGAGDHPLCQIGYVLEEGGLALRGRHHLALF